MRKTGVGYGLRDLWRLPYSSYVRLENKIGNDEKDIAPSRMTEVMEETLLHLRVMMTALLRLTVVTNQVNTRIPQHHRSRTKAPHTMLLLNSRAKQTLDSMETRAHLATNNKGKEADFGKVLD
eukprot:TRINITY_DN49208_c0_g1_i1.p2 TRINITY_DN49208_c0_g1~~TRINITY_DN49208_c0_g1_i1.p2  ORF type:complete len:123 (-),score=8.74 TRINITY_DN49208_c0_g1_i1:14-382(-)